MSAWSLSQLSVILVAATFLAPTQGKTCKDLTADTAKTLQENAKVGGHVWIHVKNPGTITGTTDVQQVGKSMFQSCADFVSVWNKWKASTGGETCSNKNKQECIKISKLSGTITKMVKCTAVTKGLCTTYSAPVDVEAVRFAYAKGSNGKMMLNTCWPSESDNCL